jgi:hypothetical protein
MSDFSYNDEHTRRLELRHFFLPGGYAVISETIVAIVALVLLNLSTFSQVLGGDNAGISANPLSLWSRVINKLLGSTQQYAFIQEMLVFLLWAFVGAMIYILVFRFIQISLRTKDSVQQGAVLIRTEHTEGALRYFASLHDLLLKIIIVALGTIAILTGTLLCFAIASQQLSNGFAYYFPHDLVNFALAFAGAFIGVRFITVGISLLSPRFRFWYNA